MWVSPRGGASPQPLETSTLFHNQQSPRAPPAWLAGIRRRQPGVRKLKTWPRIPTVNTSRLHALKSAFTTSPRWPQRQPPGLSCPLSPVPETPSLQLHSLSQPAPSYRAVTSCGLAPHLAQPLSTSVSRRGVVGSFAGIALFTIQARAGAEADSTRSPHPNPDTRREGTALGCDLSPPFPQSTL